MSSKGVVIAYWASTELSFVDMTRTLCQQRKLEFSLLKIGHHPSWFGPQRSLTKNLSHLAGIFANVLRGGFRRNVCAFGTNVCRALFPLSFLFKKMVLVYNELPAVEQGSLLFIFDRHIFRSSKNVYVSTPERAQYIQKLYGLSAAPGVLENISFGEEFGLSSAPRNSRVLFSGSITPKRFDEADLEKFRAIAAANGAKIDVYGEIAKEISDEFSSVLHYQGVLPHDALLEALKQYRFGLLAYYTGEPNYDLCAPIKLYEYVAAGCKVLSINKNAGLLAVADRFPSLISFVDDHDDPVNVDQVVFMEQRARFLAEAWRTNRRLAELIAA